MRNAIKYICDATPFYVHWKKHFCPKCGKKLELRYISKIVNSNSPEAKDYDFSVGDTFFVGNVEFRTRYLHCTNCKLNISFKEMKQQKRREKREQKENRRNATIENKTDNLE